MDYSRQFTLLNPKDIGNKTIAVVGAGATGSYVALMLAQMGWGDKSENKGKIKVFDGDIVKEHNLANQAYDKSHVGMPKVEALKEVILKKCEIEIVTFNDMITPESASKYIGDLKANYVFLLTDTMKSRKEIYESCLQYSFNTDLIIETRMGLDKGRVYAFNPNLKSEADAWKNTLYSDEEAEVSLCGTSTSVIPTVLNLASRAVWCLLHHFDVNHGSSGYTEKSGKPIELKNEVQFSLPDLDAETCLLVSSFPKT